MDKRIIILEEKGCDIRGALRRMLDDEDFYLECLTSVCSEENFYVLRQRLIDGQTKDAFDCAHALKGVLANLGLTPMFDKVVEIVEPLRQ